MIEFLLENACWLIWVFIFIKSYIDVTISEREKEAEHQELERMRRAREAEEYDPTAKYSFYQPI